MKKTITYSIILLSMLSIFAIALTACTQGNNPNSSHDFPVPVSVNLASNYSDTQQLKKFNSDAEIQDFIMQTANSGSTTNFLSKDTAATLSERTAGIMQASAGSAGGNGATDYSHTNVQVQGVDEPDIVKNDDRYIYMVTGNIL